MLATFGIASTNATTGEPGYMPAYGVKICHGSMPAVTVESLAQMLTDSSGARFGVVDTYYIGLYGHAAFPATDWYNLGYRAILTYADQKPTDPVALGDSLAKFIQLGGGVVEAVFADFPDYSISGGWRYLYAPFTVLPSYNAPGFMATVNQPLHPIMSGVSAVYMGNWRTGNKRSTLRSPDCVSLAEYGDSSRCLVACFDSAGQRAASLGMFPLTYWQSTATGQWCRLIVNALNWVAVGPSVGVTAPNGGESWPGGTVHNITWNQTSNGVKDSIYYSSDGGSSWTGVTYFGAPPSPLQYAWTVPNTPTTQARVKVVTWDADGSRVEDLSNADFTIAAPGIAQPEGGALPLGFTLGQAFPNPFAAGAQIQYALPRPALVGLRIYDVAGTLVRKLADDVQPAGNRNAYWNTLDDHGRRVAPGVYYCQLRAGDYSAAQKLVVRR
jgi:hypothetical protein